MDSLSTVRNATTSWPTRDSTSAIFVASNVALRIFGNADSGILPSVAHASQAMTSIRSQSSNLCWSDQTARIAGGEYRSIKKGDSQSMLGVPQELYRPPADLDVVARTDIGPRFGGHRPADGTVERRAG